MEMAGRARLRRAATLLGGFVVLLSVVSGPAQAASAPGRARVRPCSAGLVALTFDDGPSRTQTPRLVGMLLDSTVPATFFMVGNRIDSAPGVARRVAREGFVIGNHTWSHPQLPSLSDHDVRGQLVETGRAFRKAHVRPSRLMRPPYGAINPRVRSVIGAVHLTPVLWTVDSRDWTGGSSAQIADRILAQLRPHRRNVVLQHDGINNSPNSVGAVPIVIHRARQRGYCFAGLDNEGRLRKATSTVGLPSGTMRSWVGLPNSAAATTPASSVAPVAATAGKSAPTVRRPVRVSEFDPWFDLR